MFKKCFLLSVFCLAWASLIAPSPVEASGHKRGALEDGESAKRPRKDVPHPLEPSEEEAVAAPVRGEIQPSNIDWSVFTPEAIFKYATTQREDNPWRYIAFMEALGERDYPPALFQLGLYYGSGELIQKDIQQAFRFYQRAAIRGHSAAQTNLAFCYESGEGVEVDLGQAKMWYKKAINNGAVHALWNLGLLYEKGLGVETNLPQAFELYQRAAEKGHTQAQYYLGGCYIKGIEVGKNHQKAFELFEKASKNGHIQALCEVGVCYERGLGTPENHQSAFECYRQSAEKGYVPALYHLGQCHANGIGVEKNPQRALECYRQSAEKGCAPAQYALACIYRDGKIVPKNRLLALRWFMASKNSFAQTFVQSQLNKVSMVPPSDEVPPFKKGVALHTLENELVAMISSHQQKVEVYRQTHLEKAQVSIPYFSKKYAQALDAEKKLLNIVLGLQEIRPGFLMENISFKSKSYFNYIGSVKDFIKKTDRTEFKDLLGYPYFSSITFGIENNHVLRELQDCLQNKTVQTAQKPLKKLKTLYKHNGDASLTFFQKSLSQGQASSNVIRAAYTEMCEEISEDRLAFQDLLEALKHDIRTLKELEQTLKNYCDPRMHKDLNAQFATEYPFWNDKNFWKQ